MEERTGGRKVEQISGRENGRKKGGTDKWKREREEGR